MKFPVSRVIVLNQSPLSAVPPLARSLKNPKTALMGDLLYFQEVPYLLEEDGTEVEV